MKTKKLLFLFMLLASTVSLWAAFPTTPLSGGGAGTALDPYKIATAADLIEMRDAVNTAANAGIATSYYELTADINMSGTEWTTPIGSSATSSFLGKFDGKGHNIKNLYCGASGILRSDANLNLGLFGIINGVTIKNLGLNVSFYVSRTGLSNLGGLVSNLSGGTNTIDNCRVSGVIYINSNFSSQSANQQQRVGGIIAQVAGASSELYITNCFSDVVITSIISNNTQTGGTSNISNAAQILGDAGLVTKIGIVNCLAGGSITVTNNFGVASIGGILAARTGTSTIQTEIINCCSYTKINATFSNVTNTGVGGIAGPQNQASNLYYIKNCIALNPAINYVSQAATVPTPRRIGSKTTNTTNAFLDNYALTPMNMKAWKSTTTSFTIPAITSDATAADGANLTGADSTAQIANGLSKLAAYVTSNSTYAGIATTTASSVNLKSWGAGTIYPVLLKTPDAPTITTISAGNGQLSVAFTAGANGGSAITDYKYTVDGTTYVSVGSTTSPFTISGLTNGTVYPVQIKAVNAIGDGATSNTVSGTPVNALVAPIISFTSSTVNKIYGDATFTNTVTTNSLGAKTYTSDTPAVATVDASTGEVTVAGVGSATITVSQAATDTYTIGTQTYTLNVTAKSLSISGLAVSKPYDGTTTASVTGTATLFASETKGTGTSADGMPYTGDDVTVNSTATAGTYSSKDAGSRAITYSGLTLSGAQAANYILGTTAGTITPRALSITAPTVGTKIYNGSNAGPAVTCGTLSGFVGSETVGVSGTSTFADANVANPKIATITYTLTNGNNGGLATNYSLANGTANSIIFKLGLTQVVTSIASKPYDGTTTTGTVTLGALSGFVGTETVTVTVGSSNFADASVGNGKPATIVYALADGSNGGLASNYKCNNNTSSTGNITAISTPITGSGPVNLGNSALLPGTDLTVDNGVELYVDNSTTVRSITVSPQAKLTLNSGKTLTAGTLTLQSNENGTATFVDGNIVDNPTAVTNATVQQYLPETERNWYVSSPVSNSVFSQINRGNSVVYYDEVHGSTSPWATASGNLIPGKGYISVASASTGTGSINFQNGTLNSGLVSLPLTRTAGQTKEGFNLVGNPYPSYLTWTADMATAANVLSSVWYRTKNAGSYTFYTYNAVSDVSAPSSPGITSYIPPMQAFWVRVKTTAGGTLTFNNSMRSHGDGSTNLLKVKSAQKSVQQVLRLQVSNGTNRDEAIVLFNPNASNGFDDYDSPKMSNANAVIPEIYTTVGAESLVINGLNSFTDNQEITLGFTPGSYPSFSIKASEVRNFESGTHILLKDKVTGISHDITDGSPYDFNTDNSIPAASRFSIIFKTTEVATGMNATENSGILVYRNSLNQITVHCPGNLNTESYASVYNITGQKLTEKHLTGNITVFDSLFEPGVYIVTVHKEGKSENHKLIIQ